jgi:flagellar hook-length control protein FliK
MPQIAILPTTSTAPPPPLPNGSAESSPFSPHLKEAIQRIDEQTGNTGDRSTAAKTPGNSDIIQSPTQEDLGLSIGQQAEDLLHPGNLQPAGTQLNQGESIITLLNTPAPTNAGAQGQSLLPDTASLAALLVNTGGKGQQYPPGQSIPNQSPQNPSGQNIPAPVSLPFSTTTNPNSGNPLLRQLQSIIDGGEKGVTMSIIASGKALRVSTDGGTITTRTDAMPQQSIIAAISLEDAGDSTTMPSYGALRLEGGTDQQQGPTTLRQSMQQQYFESKLTVGTKNDGNSGAGDKQPQNGATTTQGGLAANNDTATLPTTETPTAFSHILAQSPSAYRPLGHESLQPVLLPSGSVVYQEEVIRHIAERFHVMRRDSDTRINLQLHPAELGALRIDLSVKNGMVRANVVASTQIAQDIIEKNMPRLRSILEQQGFSIDEILVSNSSPAVDDFNLFDRQHYDDRGSQHPSSPKGDTSSAVFTLDGLNPVQEGSTGGVNVKI